jgi:regulatory protein
MKESPTSPVTALEPDPRREGVVRIIVDGRAFLSVPIEAVRAEGIEVGVTISAAQLTRLERAADHEAAFRTAVRLLGRRPFARVDLARRLKLKGHLPDAVTAALDRAQALDYLDDDRFARQYVESRSSRGRGPARLRAELAQMGVARGTIDSALSDETSDQAIERQIDRLLTRRLPSVKDLAGNAARQRLLAYLARRGFVGYVARRKVVEALRVAGNGTSGGGENRPRR